MIPRPRLITTTFALSALTGAIFLGGCGKPPAPHAMPPAEISVITVKPETVPMSREYIGRGVSPYDVELRALVTGTLKERLMVDGAEVKAGDLLFVIDDTPFKAAADNAEARATQFESELKNAERTLERVRSLVDSRAVSDKDLDDATNGVTGARARLAGARSELVKARWDLANTRITAPVSGRVGKANVVPGSPILAGADVLVRLQQTDPIWVQFSIPESVILSFSKDVSEGRVTNAKESDFRVDLTKSDGTPHPLPGRMNFSDINLNTTVSAMEARAIFANADHKLLPGQFFTVKVSGPKKEGVFLVPQRAVQINPTNKYVFVVAKAKDKDGKEFDTVETRDVQTGEWIGDRWVIESGLKDGDRVVVEGVIGIQMRGGAGVAAVAPADFKPAAEKPAAAPAK